MGSFFKTCFFAAACVAFLVLLHDVVILEWHSWDAHLLGLPTGLGWGLLEVIVFSACAVAAFLFCCQEFWLFAVEPYYT